MVRVFVIERTFHQTEGWDGAWTSPLECCAPQALVEKCPYIYMGGYDPKVIKNREKLHFFFRPPLFLLSTLANSMLFPCKLRTASLPTCRHFPPLFSLKTSVVRPQKSPPHQVQRGLFIVFRGRPSQRCSSASLKMRGRFAQDEGDSLKMREHQHTLIAKFRALLYRQPANVPTVPHRAQ